MASVAALQSFTGVFEKDVLGPDRIEQHSEYPNAPSVFPGGKVYPDRFIDQWGRDLSGKTQPTGSLIKNVVKHGKTIGIQKGQLFESNHPAVKKWPSMFGAVEELHPQERATK